jgi:hypothetical protein
MPYYKQQNILFIHIPKTGGTIIENSLKKICGQSLYSNTKNVLLPDPYNTISLQHQIYTTLYEYKNKLNIDFENVKIFSVVRNPYDRIISDLFWRSVIDKKFLVNKNSTPDKIFDIIKNNYLYRSDYDNHNIPQYKFVTDKNGDLIPNIKIFKTETLNKDNEIINDYLKVNLNIINKDVNKDYSKYLNKDSIKLINEFYKKDFELFNYDMITEI